MVGVGVGKFASLDVLVCKINRILKKYDELIRLRWMYDSSIPSNSRKYRALTSDAHGNLGHQIPGEGEPSKEWPPTTTIYI